GLRREDDRAAATNGIGAKLVNDGGNERVHVHRPKIVRPSCILHSPEVEQRLHLALEPFRISRENVVKRGSTFWRGITAFLEQVEEGTHGGRGGAQPVGASQD